MTPEVSGLLYTMRTVLLSLPAYQLTEVHRHNISPPCQSTGTWLQCPAASWSLPGTHAYLWDLSEYTATSDIFPSKLA